MVRRAVVALLVFGVAGLGAPAFAADGAAEPTSPGRIEAGRQINDALARSMAAEARRLAQTEPAAAAADTGGSHWCAGGLALLAAGVAAAAVAAARRDPNPQKPSPPVGFVLGSGAAAVGGVQMIRACRH